MEPPTTAHYWIAVLDLEDFSDRSDPVQVSLRSAMDSLVRTAVADAHLDWRTIGVKDEGDGMILLFPAHVSPISIAGDFIGRLRAGLDEAARFYTEEHSVRFRLALHHGLATADTTGWPGQATNTACRLVDAEELRVVLRTATRARLAVIASDEFYRAVIRPGNRAIDPSTYAPVTVHLKKAPGTRAWIHVPGYPTPPGLPRASLPRFPASSATSEAPAPASNGTAQPGERRITVQGDYIERDKNVHYYGGQP